MFYSLFIFGHFFSGIILVHDLTNRKSQLNLKKWLAEVMNKDSRGHHDLCVFFINVKKFEKF